MKIKDIPKIHRITKVGKRIICNEESVIRALCKESYFDFVREAWSIIVPEKPVWNWHIEHACNEIQDMLERVFANKHKTHDLCYCQPPATTKSKVFSVFLLPWAWTRMPSFRMAGVSYAQELSLDLSNQSRKLIKSDWYQRLFPEIKLSKDQDTKHFFTNTLGGQRYSAGSGGTITGKHFHVLVVDDPINPQEALSDAEVERTNRWITDTLMSRKVDENISVVMLVMQRLRQNDPAGMFTAMPGVKKFVLPATTEYPIFPPELEAKYINGLLDPVRLSREILKKKKDGMDEYGFAAQYMESPVPLGGGMFMTKLLKYSSFVPPLVRVYRFWDKANTKNRGAYTVGVKMGLDKNNHVYILDCVRGRWDTHSREIVIRQTAWRDGKDVFIGLEQEPGSGSKEGNERTIARLIGFKCKSIAPKGDKEMRAVPFSTQVNASNVTLVTGDWNKEYIEELAYFPYSTWKDQVDASSGAFTCLTSVRRRLGAI